MTELAFGTWPSPLSADVLGTSRISVAGLQVHDRTCWWTESRPSSGGLQVLMRADLARGGRGEPPADDTTLPAGTGVRSRVHEYGGGAFFVTGAGVIYTGQQDQALWLISSGAASPLRLTPEAPAGEEHRYSDARPVPGTSFVVVVKESHRLAAQDDELVVVDLDRPGDEPAVLLAGRDFFTSPRPSPDGRLIAWISWDLPRMPWDGCELWVADLVGGASRSPRLEIAGPRLVAGGTDESTGQPVWLSEASLLFVSDLAGFWQPYTWEPGSEPARLCDLEADFHYPDWNLGQSTLAMLGGDKLVCRIEHGGRDSVVVLGVDDGEARELDQPCVAIRALAVTDDGEVVVSGSTASESGVVVGVRLDGSTRRIASRNTGVSLSKSAVSLAEPMSFETAGGVTATLNFYRPKGQTPGGGPIVGPAGALPPVVVYCHGGPTAAAEAGFDPWIQFWTTRGFAVACVNYRGSTGRGREFRKLLDGNWGLADAEDCVAALSFLADLELVDGDRAMIRGGSSGGLTCLRALSISRSFAGALVSCGVTDLRALAEGTHKFESGYLEALVGPYPAEMQRYEERSPVCRPELINGAVLLLQGDEDAVVPPSQAASMAEALRRRGVRCDHVLFAGEGHGFRRAESISGAARRELEFSLDVLGIEFVTSERSEA